jgi:hypothetical protein
MMNTTFPVTPAYTQTRQGTTGYQNRTTVTQVQRLLEQQSTMFRPAQVLPWPRQTRATGLAEGMTSWDLLHGKRMKQVRDNGTRPTLLSVRELQGGKAGASWVHR